MEAKDRGLVNPRLEELVGNTPAPVSHDAVTQGVQVVPECLAILVGCVRAVGRGIRLECVPKSELDHPEKTAVALGLGDGGHRGVQGGPSFTTVVNLCLQ